MAWLGATTADRVLNLGPLALIQPLLQRLALVRRCAQGKVISATAPTDRQRQILHRLGLPTPAQTLARTLSPIPTD